MGRAPQRAARLHFRTSGACSGKCGWVRTCRTSENARPPRKQMRPRPVLRRCRAAAAPGREASRCGSRGAIGFTALQLPVLLRRLQRPTRANRQRHSCCRQPTRLRLRTPHKNEPLPYSAAWHHRHLYAPRSVSVDSNMPSYRFLMRSGESAANVRPTRSTQWTDAPPEGWEIVPTYDAQMSRRVFDVARPIACLKEVKSTRRPRRRRPERR